jgi:DNA-binding HxlR family transcriptional regulator
MTRYDHKIDSAIISHLYKNEKANFSQLLRRVQRLHKGISKKVLSSHLKKLQEDNIIRRDKDKIGAARYSYLTKLARQQIRLRIPVHVKSKREKRTSMLDRRDVEELATKRKKAYQLLFFIASSGARRLKPNPKPEPGDIALRSADGKLAAYSYHSVSGVGASDFSVEPKEILGQAGALSPAADLSPSEVAGLFDILLKEKPPLIRPVGEFGGETRYGIADRSLADYIAHCWALFPFVRWRMEETWKFRRKPTRDEVEWYAFFYGKRKAKSFFAAAQESRKRSKTDGELRRSSIKSIKDWDGVIRRQLEGRRDEKGSYHPGIYKKYGPSVMKEYKFPAQVLLDMIYPKFLKELHKKKKI